MEFSLQDELNNLSNGDYQFSNELGIERMDSSEINATLNGKFFILFLMFEQQ